MKSRKLKLAEELKFAKITELIYIENYVLQQGLVSEEEGFCTVLDCFLFYLFLTRIKKWPIVVCPIRFHNFKQ